MEPVATATLGRHGAGSLPPIRAGREHVHQLTAENPALLIDVRGDPLPGQPPGDKHAPTVQRGDALPQLRQSIDPELHPPRHSGSLTASYFLLLAALALGSGSSLRSLSTNRSIRPRLSSSTSTNSIPI